MIETRIIQNKENINSNTTLKNSIKIQGTLTSQIQLRGENTSEPYYYSFIRLKGQSIDLPVIFKLKENDKLSKPNLKKTDEAELSGYYSNSLQNVRKSFTCSAYQLLNHQRIRKKCLGCLDNFTGSQSQNYDYCKDCELNGSRYVARENKCPECGDGSGIIKFPNQSSRSCKTCTLTNQEIQTNHD